MKGCEDDWCMYLGVQGGRSKVGVVILLSERLGGRRANCVDQAEGCVGVFGAAIRTY